MNREGITMARRTVERLMRRLGLHGMRRGTVVRTTRPDPAASCPLDRVNRQFRADRPNQLWVSDFTYVSTWQGWLYVALVIDVYARRIVGWRVSPSMQTDFVLYALEQDLYDRRPEREGLMHHSDRGSQYLSTRCAELIHRRAPWNTREAVELATLQWVHRFNHIRLLEPIGYIPPAEAEAHCHRQLSSQTAVAV